MYKAISRRNALQLTFTSLVTGMAHAQEVAPVFAPFLPNLPLDNFLKVDDELLNALGNLKTFAGGKNHGGNRFIAILSVDCVWCRFQYAENRKIVHMHDIKYALTYSDAKYAPLIDPALLGPWNSKDGIADTQNHIARRIFHGISSIESEIRTAEQLKIITEQHEQVENLFSLLRDRFEPRGIEILGYPMTLAINSSATQLAIVSVGYAPRNYYSSIRRFRNSEFYEQGLSMLRGFVRGSPKSTEYQKGSLTPSTWGALAELFFFPTGGTLRGRKGSQTKTSAFVLFDPCDIAARTLWHNLLVVEFYIEFRWVPIPDFDDIQSIVSWIYLHRAFKGSKDKPLAFLEKEFISVMLGYQPNDKTLKPTADEEISMIKSKVLADRLLLLSTSLPIIVWKSHDGVVTWEQNPSLEEIVTQIASS